FPKLPPPPTDSTPSGAAGSNNATNNRLKQTQAQVDEVVGIMRVNVEKVLERDQKLSELDQRADALQHGASQFEQQAGKLKRKQWWANMKMMIIMGVIGVVLLIIIILWIVPGGGSSSSPAIESTTTVKVEVTEAPQLKQTQAHVDEAHGSMLSEQDQRVDVLQYMASRVEQQWWTNRAMIVIMGVFGIVLLLVIVTCDTRPSGVTGSNTNTTNDRLKQTQAKVDEVHGIILSNVEKVLERDQKLSELHERADALEQNALQFQQLASKLKGKQRHSDVKMKIMIVAGVIGAVLITIIIRK
uniref:V-SNARE coiled-coil homology domain-containing protein n=1 Tax=Anopheles dirus TaxID=7168 RepID=A0A182NHB0_9DIPT